MAKSLSLSSPSYIAEVIKGKKNLSQKLILKLGEVQNLSEREFKYFETLVKFNQAKWMEEKNYFFNQLSKFKDSRAKIIHENQYKFYTKWYYSAVLTLIGMHPKESNPFKLGQMVFPSIGKKQVEESIQLLLHLNLIKKAANGYAPTNSHLVTENPFRSMVATQYNHTFMDMAKDALVNVAPNSRQYNVLMFSISEKGFYSIKERIRNFQEELRDIIDRDENEDRIYSMCIQLFPNSTKH